MTNARIILNVFFLFMTLSACQQSKEVFETDEGAVNGYDVVAYFKNGTPTKGKQEYWYSWNGAQWYFSSEKNLEEFKGSPENFAPQYGGYCAFGTAEGHKAPTDPNAWTIVDGKLYLNYNMEVMQMWRPNKEELIKKANTNWPKVKME